MAKKRQHYVPLFYLKAFESAPRRIHLFHLQSRRVIQHASMRDQCYSHRFYGPDEIEDILAQLEGAAASVIQAIIASGEPPTPGTEQHGTLLAFVCLQILRTPVARQNIQNSWIKMDKQIFGDADPAPESGLSRFSPVSDQEVLRLQFQMMPRYVEGLTDLDLHVARSPSRAMLITSDNPVVRYNTYCRGIRYWGVIGANNRGLQVFLPLSPRVLLLLYDGAVYHIGRPTGSIGLSAGDVKRLNALQIMNAEHAIYFPEWSDAEDIQRLAHANLRFRQSDAMRVNEGPVDGSETSSIVHLWERQPDLQFSLPLSDLRWKASKVALKARATQYRREWGS